MSHRIREVREGDLPFLATHLRAADLIELTATYGHTRVLEALTVSVEASDQALVAVDDNDKPFTLFGYRAVGSFGVIWACATPVIETFKMSFLRNCRHVIQSWFDKEPKVSYFANFTHGQNSLHHRWLAWCGATVLPHELPYGALGHPFRAFTIRRETYV